MYCNVIRYRSTLTIVMLSSANFPHCCIQYTLTVWPALLLYITSLSLSLSPILTFPLPSPCLLPLQHNQVRVCLGHYASRGLKDPLRGKDMHKLVGIEITDSATIRYRREKVSMILQSYL